MIERFVLILLLVNRVFCGNRPIIGILAQEDGDSGDEVTIIASSYVKMMEASGTRVVPIFTNQNQSYYENLLSSINGVVFPGGSVDLTKNGGMVKAGNLVFEYAKKANRMGNTFPILGVCQGMELLLYLSNNKNFPLVACKGLTNVDLPLKFIVDYNSSMLYRRANELEIETLTNSDSTVNHHSWCMTIEDLKKFRLDQQWRPLTVNNDVNNLVFISSMESFQYPFAAVQFHPEKTAFEWRPDEKNAHSIKSVYANRIFYDWLASKARESKNRFKTNEEALKSVISNYRVTFEGLKGGYNDEIYFFQN